MQSLVLQKQHTQKYAIFYYSSFPQKGLKTNAVLE